MCAERDKMKKGRVAQWEQLAMSPVHRQTCHSDCPLLFI
jgi:hypothetical protein